MFSLKQKLLVIVMISYWHIVLLVRWNKFINSECCGVSSAKSVHVTVLQCLQVLGLCLKCSDLFMHFMLTMWCSVGFCVTRIWQVVNISLIDVCVWTVAKYRLVVGSRCIHTYIHLCLYRAYWHHHVLNIVISLNLKSWNFHEMEYNCHVTTSSAVVAWLKKNKKV